MGAAPAKKVQESLRQSLDYARRGEAEEARSHIAPTEPKDVFRSLPFVGKPKTIDEMRGGARVKRRNGRL